VAEDESPRIIPEPMTQLAEGAAGMHECYTAYVRAGFTPGPDGEALRLVIAMLTQAIGGTQQ
jgi:hypothetical protein